MSDFTTLAPRVMLSRAWIWMESNGWYVVGALALWFAVIWPSVLAPALRAARSTAHAPSAAKVRDYEEGMRAARERQEAAAKRAQEAHAEHERERRARQAEELRGAGSSTSRGWTQARERERRRSRLARRAQAET